MRVARTFLSRSFPAALAVLVSSATSAFAQGAPEPYPDAAPAPAPPPPPVATPPSGHEYGEALATELFNTGRDLMAVGRHAEACPKLAESARLEERVGTLGKLAECEERLGQLVRARTHWQQALNLARVQGDDRLPLAEQEFRRLDGIVPKVQVTVQGAMPAGLKLKIDDLELGANSVGVPIPLDPGRHTVTVTAPGKKAWSKPIHLKPDGAIARLAVPPLADAAPAKQGGVVTRTPTPLPPADTTSPLRTTAFVAGGLSIVSLVVGGYFGVTARSKLELSNALGCDGSACTEKGATARNDARDAGNLSTAFFLAGGALAAGAITLYVVGTDSEPQTSVKASAGLDGISLRGSF